MRGGRSHVQDREIVNRKERRTRKVVRIKVIRNATKRLMGGMRA